MTAGRHGRRTGDASTRAHELRSSLNAIHMWAHVLDGRLRLHADPEVRRALDGMRSAVDAHLRLLENLMEAPGGRDAAQKEEDARNKSTRTGER